MIVTARQFTSAAECIANAAAVRARLFNPKVRPVIKTKPVKHVVSLVRLKKKVLPGWMLVPTTFDEHVIAYRIMLRIREMQAKGEIEIVIKSRPTVQQIATSVLVEFPGLGIADLKSSRRSREICLARQTAMYEVRQQRPDLSFPVIGRWFGGRDHTTVLHAVRKIEAMRGGVE